MVRDGGLHLVVVNQAIDQHLPPCELEFRDLDIEARIDVIDHAIHFAAEIPAHAGQQKELHHRRHRQQD